GSLGALLAAFWFDVTKADWRETTVLTLPASMIGERLRMYEFDIMQQFGWTGPLLAGMGLLYLATTAPRRPVLLLTMYFATLAFALSYNVGDVHVFPLPSHLTLVFMAACAPPLLKWGSQRIARRLVWRTTAAPIESKTNPATSRGWNIDFALAI